MTWMIPSLMMTFLKTRRPALRYNRLIESITFRSPNLLHIRWCVLFPRKLNLDQSRISFPLHFLNKNLFLFVECPKLLQIQPSVVRVSWFSIPYRKGWKVHFDGEAEAAIGCLDSFFCSEGFVGWTACKCIENDWWLMMNDDNDNHSPHLLDQIRDRSQYPLFS